MHISMTCHCVSKALAALVQAHEKEGYRWWAQRLGRSFQLYDETRIDHFRGFAGDFITATPCSVALYSRSLLAYMGPSQHLARV